METKGLLFPSSARAGEMKRSENENLAICNLVFFKGEGKGFVKLGIETAWLNLCLLGALEFGIRKEMQGHIRIEIFDFFFLS